MFRKNKVVNYTNKENEPITKLSHEDISNVSGGIVVDRGTYFLVLNTSGMGVVQSIVRYGGTGQLTKPAAAIEANRLDAIDYSIL
ncbi:MAG: hypothetical protein RUMPE_01028 [Eubacteriales bacterium SKADARSKE-1]|nr:hypothetical protein [Eubacteriales bacterium SKADARSKE-1]